MAHRLSGGLRTGMESTYSAAARKLSPIDRTSSPGYKSPTMLPESTEHYESITTHSNRIPLPRLERPVYVHFEERMDEEMPVYAT